jgi:hypothetical protein
LVSESAPKSGRQPLCFSRKGILTRRSAAILLMLVDSGIRCYIRSTWDVKSKEKGEDKSKALRLICNFARRPKVVSGESIPVNRGEILLEV